jgi:hypothetical protein
MRCGRGADINKYPILDKNEKLPPMPAIKRICCKGFF